MLLSALPQHNVIGLDVPSTAPVFLVFVGMHVAAGLTCVVAGAVAALSRKGGGRHTAAGKVYFAGITVVFATATALAVMRWREDYGFFLIGLTAFSLALTGFLARERHWPGDTAHITGMGGSYVAMLTAFYVDNGKHLPLWDRLPTATFWVLPSAVGVPLIVRAVRKYAGLTPPAAGLSGETPLKR
jgi:uncharacterized membrane protein